MAAAKLVKNFFVLALFCAEILHVNGMRISSEDDDHIIYDQRQSGKYNIHVVIKDVAIIEMDQNEIADQNYNDEDYYYDEDDLTIKPLNIKTSSTSAKPLYYTTSNRKSTPAAETTISLVGSQSDETTSNTPVENFNASLTANISKTNDKKFHDNVTDLINFLTTYRPAVDIKSRSKVEPINAIEGPILKSRQHRENFNYEIPTETQHKLSTLAKKDSTRFPSSRIFKVKVHRFHRTPQTVFQRAPCRQHQYSDARGNCHGKRSSSGSIL